MPAIQQLGQVRYLLLSPSFKYPPEKHTHTNTHYFKCSTILNQRISENWENSPSIIADTAGEKKSIKIVYKFPKALYSSKTAKAVNNLLDKYELPESVIKC